MKTKNRQNDMPCCERIFNSIPSVALVSLIFWTYYVFLYEFCIVDLKGSTTRQIPCLVIGNICFVMFAWCYFYAVCCDANYYIPNDFKLSTAEHDEFYNLSLERQIDYMENLIKKRKMTIWLRTSEHLVRYCMRCRQIKPDRAHHCSTCGRCVLKMDHHCPWINNCVGFANQKSFVLMCLYGTFGGLTFAVFFVEYYLHIGIIKPSLHLGFLISGFFLATLLAVLASVLGCQQMYLILRNVTVLETIQDLHFTNPNLTFNHGCKQNFLDVFGEFFWTWFIPIKSAIGDGINYEVRFKERSA